MATSTPWGQSQYSEKIARGIMNYGTCSHGGVHVSPTKNVLIPEYMRNADGWYEEDCEWAKVAVVFAEEYSVARGGNINEIAEVTLRHWFPDAYEKFFGKKVVKGESVVRDKEIFKEENKNNYIVVSACRQEDGVSCIATLGGHRKFDGSEKYFMVPANEYEAGRYGFVIDLEKHHEIVDNC